MGDRSLYLGLISGTSADAIDAALVAFDGTTPRCLATAATPYAPALEARILDLALGRVGADFDRCGALDVEIGEAFAAAAEALIRASGVRRNRIREVGSHGQTLWHRPDASPPFSVQLGDPNVIAEPLRLCTVADFRRRDIAAGGQGAPLAPAFHDAFLASPTEARAVLNLGGIANLTLSGAPLAGKEVFSPPRFIPNLGTDYRINGDWQLGLQGRAQGKYFIDDMNAKGKYGGFAVLDASLRYNLTPEASVDLQIRNLTDRKYEYVWYYNFFWGGSDQPMFSPAPGRSGYLSLNVKM